MGGAICADHLAPPLLVLEPALVDAFEVRSLSIAPTSPRKLLDEHKRPSSHSSRGFAVTARTHKGK
eukprot:4194517-Pleurochrysis_carterae.AAC.3